MTGAHPRVLAIALGEATMDLIVPWAEQGLLPNFKRLMDGGTSGCVRSQIPLITPQMWGTIMTGRSAGHHGAYDFLQRGSDGKFHAIDGSALKVPTLWQHLAQRGIRCGVVNVPFTYPPQRIEGFVIAGQDAPGAHPSIAAPMSVYSEVVKKFGRYHLKDIFPGGRKKEDYLTLIEDEVGRQTDVLEHLIATQSWQFFITFFSATAMAQHYFWSDMESSDPKNPFQSVIYRTYRALDEAIGRLAKAAGPDTRLVIFSECGAGRLRSGVQINAWLAREGFLAWSKPPSTEGASGTFAAKKSPLAAALSTLRKRAKRLSPGLLFLMNRHLSDFKVWSELVVTESAINWSRTRAFSRGKEGDIFLNLKGRDPKGTVAPGAAYDALCRDICRRLEALIDPQTGEHAVKRTYQAKELYDGPTLAWAPDIVVEWKDTLYMPTEDDGDRVSIFVERMRDAMNWPTTGSHRLDGVLIAAGPGIAPARKAEPIRLLDLAPTWLHMLNQPVPAEWEGRAIKELLI